MEALEIFVLILGCVLGLTLYIKVWRMSDDIREIRNSFLKDKLIELNKERKRKTRIIVLSLIVVFAITLVFSFIKEYNYMFSRTSTTHISDFTEFYINTDSTIVIR